MDLLSIQSETPPVARAPKIAGFDAVRAAAAFGVVLLHCCVPYMKPPVPGLAWSVHDTPNWLVAECFWTIELFIMPLFLVIAGFFSWQTLERSGSGRLIKTRARRLLVPLLFGAIVILPLDLYAWLLGWVTEGLIAPQKLRSLKFDGIVDRDLWGLSHLWFLQYLFLYVVVMAGATVAWRRLPEQLQRMPGVTSTVSILLSVGALTLYFHPEVVWGFQHSFLPVPSKWVYSGVFFAIGAMLSAHDCELGWLRSHAKRLIAPAVLMTITALAMGQWHLQGGSNDVASATLAILTCLGAVLATLAIIAVAAERVQTVSLSVSYLAAASFWVYVVHHPVLGLVHIDLKWMLPGVSPIVKVVLAFVITSSLSLATYELWVRRTTLGRWLGFQWQPPRSHTDVEADAKVISIDSQRSPASQPERRAA